MSGRATFAVVAMGALLAATSPAQVPPPAPAAPQEWTKRAFVEVVASKRAPFVGESFELRLHFGFDEELLASHLVPLFARELDLPVQVEWSGWPSIDGLTFHSETGPRGAAAGARRFALGDAVELAAPAAPSVRDGRNFQTFEFVRRATATRAGRCDVPAASLRFAAASRIEDDLIRGKVPVDREVVRVAGGALALDLRPLPEAGRPPEFTGAVGRKTIAASAAPVRLAVGESVQLTLTIAGAGDLEAFAAPSLARLPGFALRGVLDRTGANAREIVYDLAPLDARVSAIPAVAFAWFSPEAPVGYVTERTEPIALTVAPGAAGAAGATGPAAGAPTASEGGGTKRIAAVVAVAVAIAAALLFVVRRSARRGGAAARSAGAAAAALRARLADPDSDAADAFVDYLAARLGVAPAAVVSPDLAARLERRGVPRELAAEVAARLTARIAARYAGGAAPSSADRSGASAEFARLSDRLDPLDFGPPPGAGGAAPPR